MAVHYIGGGKFDPASPAVFTSSLEDVYYAQNIANKLNDHAEKLIGAHDQGPRMDRLLNQIRANPEKVPDIEALNSVLQKKLEVVLAEKFPGKPPGWLKDTAQIVIHSLNEAMANPVETVTHVIGDKVTSYTDDIVKLNTDLHSKYGMRLDDIVAIQTPDLNFDSSNIDQICKTVRKFIDQGPSSGISLLNSTDLAKMSLPQMNMSMKNAGYDSQELRDRNERERSSPRNTVMGLN